MLKFTLPGPPIPQARPRLGCNGVVFNSQYKIKKHVKEQLYSLCKFYRHIVPYRSDIPIKIEMNFYLPLPKKNDKKFLNLFSWGCIDNVSKPDDDNLEKFYKDCLNKIVYDDDRQIISTILKKEYSENPRTEIKIMAKEKKLPDKAKEILSFLNPDELIKIIEDLDLISDCLENTVLENEEFAEKIQLEAACLISEFADKFSPIFSKISKKYPNLWEELRQNQKENNENKVVKMENLEQTPSGVGKTLC